MQRSSLPARLDVLTTPSRQNATMALVCKQNLNVNLGSAPRLERIHVKYGEGSRPAPIGRPGDRSWAICSQRLKYRKATPPKPRTAGANEPLTTRKTLREVVNAFNVLLESAWGNLNYWE